MTATWNPESERPGVLVGVSQRHAGRSATRNAAFFLPHLRPGMSVLDVGCGPGAITVGLAEAVAPGEVLGLDIDQEQVDKARALASERGLPNVRFDTGDIYALPFPDNSFDALFAHTVFMHLKEPPVAAREVLRVLKPGGVFGVSERMHDGSVLNSYSDLLPRFWLLYDAWAEHRGVDLRIGSRLRGLLRQAGFERVVGSASYGEVYGTLEATRRCADICVTVIRNSSLPQFAEEHRLVDRQTLEQMASAWEAWAEEPNSFYAQANGEAVGWKSDDLL